MPDPHVIFDLRHRAVEVILDDAEVAGTLELDDAHLVDVDADGRVVGIEILTLGDWKLDEMGERFGFHDQIPAIRAELEKVLMPSTRAAVVYGPAMVIHATHVPRSSPRAETDESSEAPEVPPVIA